MTTEPPPPTNPWGRLKEQLRGGGFLRQVATLISGSVGGQILLFALSPILARLYGPADFATLALFAASTSIFAVALTGRYDFAIVLERDDTEALNVTIAALSLATVGAGGLQLLCFYFGPAVLSTLSIPDDQGWLLYFPLGSGLWATFDIFSRWHSRDKLFARMALASVSYSGSMGTTQLSAALALPGLSGIGLVWGQLVGRIVGIGVLSRAAIASFRSTDTNPSVAGAVRALRRHWRFPAYSVPSGLLNRVQGSLPAFMIPVFGADILGFYALCNRVLAAPVSVVGAAVSQVFFPKMAEIRDQPERTRRLLVRAYLILGLLISPAAVIIFFWGVPIFEFVFGEEWRVAGEFARLMLPLMVTRFIVAPTGLSMQAFGRQFEVLMWTLLYVVMSVSVLYYGTNYADAHSTVFLYASGCGAMYTIYLFMSLYYGARPPKDTESSEPR